MPSATDAHEVLITRPANGTGDVVLLITRIVALALLPFLLIAVLLLYLFPFRTGELFAWPIDPPLSAYLLASAYVGGIWFFARVAFAPRWHHVRHGFPAVVVFAAALLAATLLHLDRFSANLSSAVWLALYATTPLVVAVLAVVQARRGERKPEELDVVIPRFAALGLAGVGTVALGLGALLFTAPLFAEPYWAWDLTPLTGRVTGAVLSLSGVVNMALLWDRRWSAFRVLFQAQLASLIAICVSLLVRSDDLRWDQPLTVALVILIGTALVVYASFTAWCERQLRRHAREFEERSLSLPSRGFPAADHPAGDQHAG